VVEPPFLNTAGSLARAAGVTPSRMPSSCRHPEQSAQPHKIKAVHRREVHEPGHSPKQGPANVSFRTRA